VPQLGVMRRSTEAIQRGGAALAMDELWKAIASHSEEPFATKNGIPFTYIVSGDSLHLQNTNQVLGRAQFEDAAGRKGITKPSDLGDLRGSSYTWAILQDPRIGAFKG
jgi:hypothetical protein